MATLAAGGLMNSDVMKSFRKVDEMLRWIPYVAMPFVVCTRGYALPERCWVWLSIFDWFSLLGVQVP